MDKRKYEAVGGEDGGQGAADPPAQRLKAADEAATTVAAATATAAPTEDVAAAPEAAPTPAADPRLQLYRVRPRFEYHTERYYTSFSLDAREGGGPQYLALHLNNLGVVGIALNHPATAEPITAVNFNMGKKGEDRLTALKPKGKKKSGGLFLHPEAKLAILTGASGTQYRVHVGIEGTLVELNEALVNDPDLVRLSPTDQGWIGVVIPTTRALAELKKRAETEGLAKTSAFQRLAD